MKIHQFPLRAILAVSVILCALAAHAQPYIEPYAPPGWSAPVVVTTDPNSTTQSPAFYTTNEIYVAFSFANSGNADAETEFDVDLETNSIVFYTFNVPPPFYQGSYEEYAQPNIDIGTFPVGTNTISILVDTNEVYDTPPAGYTNTFVVQHPVVPPFTAPTLITPANGSANQSTSPVFTWSAIPNAQYYVIAVATNSADLPSNTNAVTGGASLTIIGYVTNATTFTPENPIAPGMKYYWEVNARFLEDGGPWSGVSNFTTATPPAGLTILPVFDGNITSDPQVVAIENTIKAAVGAYQNNFSDPLTVSITFHETNSGLGESSWSFNSYSYPAYRAALVTAMTTADDSTALAHLPVQADNPVNENQDIDVKTALAYDLGLNGGSSGENVGAVFLYTGIMNLNQAQNNPINSNYSLFSVACHEIDEVLATGSELDQVNAGHTTLSGHVFPEDLFRYGAPGVRSYTTSAGATSYFSLDGTNDLAQFNQVGSGDYGDWYSYNGVQTVSQVQDAFSLPGTSPNLGVELRVLDVLGYHRVILGVAPEFVSVTRSGNNLKLVWTAGSGSGYQLQYTTVLNPSAWTNLGGIIMASSSTASYTDTIGGTQRFYRVGLVSGSGSNVLANRSQTIVPPTGWGTSILHAYHP